MELNDIMALPNTLTSINIMLDYLKSNSFHSYKINLKIMKIYYKLKDQRFLNYYEILNKSKSPDDETFQNFLAFKVKYLTDIESYDEAFQNTSQLKDKHQALGRIYFETNHFIESLREYILCDNADINLAYIYLHNQEYDKALAASENYSQDHHFIEVMKNYHLGAKLDFSHIMDPNIALSIRIAIAKMKELNNSNAYLEGKKVLSLVDDVYLGLRVQFYQAYYKTIKDHSESEKIYLELENLNKKIEAPLIYKGNDSTTIEMLENQYKAFDMVSKLISSINKIDNLLPFREIYRLAMIELNSFIPFKESIILYQYEQEVFIIDYKRNLAYDKTKPLDILFNTPFEDIIINGHEKLISSYQELKNKKDIITSKYLYDINVLKCLGYPIFDSGKTVGAIVYYFDEGNLFREYYYEIIKIFTNLLLEKKDINVTLNKDVASYASYKYLFDNVDLAIKYIYLDEVHFNNYGQNLNEKIDILGFEETNLIYQEGLVQLKNGTINDYTFDFQINKRYYSEKMRRIKMGEAYIIFSIIYDMTESHLSLKYQTALAENSYICNLPNRRVLERVLADYVEDKFTLFCLDINRFKMFNDIYGYEAGDIALKTLGRELGKIDESFSCFHIDGDKFIILYPLVNDQRAIKKVATKITSTLEEEMKKQNYRFNFTFTIASIRYPVHTTDKRPTRLIKYAINSLYNAKDHLGLKSRYLDYDVKMYKNDIYEQVLLTQVSEAMDNSMLEICYQQIVDLKTSKVFQYEALVSIPSFNVDPKYVYQVAYKRHLMRQIDRYAIHTILQEQSKIVEETHKLCRLSIPIDVETFMDDDFVSFLKSEILANATKCDFITIEIKGKLDQYENANSKITEVRNIGIKIAINDLFDLLRISCDYIKLYNSSQYLNNPHSLEMLKSMERLASESGRNLILCDVDTLDEASLLKGFDMKYVMGKCYSKRVNKDYLIKVMGGSKCKK